MFPTAGDEDITQVTSLTENPTTSSNDHNSTENTQISSHHNNRELTLNMLIKEIVFCIALALTAYGALHNTSTKISKHPQAVRFFSPESVVVDWYRGQLSRALSIINNADVSFVMYYAPWDAESQYVRREFEKAAMILSHRVHFAAINCWNPGSECRIQHNKIPSWPILMAYTVNSRGVLYKGIRDAHSMVKFLELIMRPIKRISLTEDLVNMLSICDAVAVAFTPLSETSKYYNIWYNVALKSREFDPVGEICYGAVTSEELAVDLGVDVVPNVRLMLWNDTKELINEGSRIQQWNESTLMYWVLENFAQPVARIIPMWKKAFSFERYVDGNPILILFTPLNPMYEQLPSYALLREVAMEYSNCKNNATNQWTSELIKLQQIQRLLYQQKNVTSFCDGYKFNTPRKKHNHLFKKEIESRNNKYPWSNSTHKTQKNGIFNFLLKRDLDISKAIDNPEDSQLLSSLNLLQECSMTVSDPSYTDFEQCQSYEKYLNEEQEKNMNREIDTSMLPFEDDPYSAESLIQDNIKHFCKLMRFAHEWGPTAFPTRVPDERRNVTNVQGLACATNSTLYMLAVDSVKNHHFAEALGIDITSKKDMTGVVILDSKQESQYVLSGDYNAKSIRDFVYNFTAKRLKRSLRTRIDDAAHTHYFGSDGLQELHASNDTVNIVDLTTKTFRRLVKTPGAVSIVVVCGGACGWAAARAAAAAAGALRAGGVRAAPARLDALRHDLPWHYHAARYPTVFVFPADRSREAESRSYPAELRVSSGGIVALALRAVRAPQRMRVRLALCAHAPTIAEKHTCLKDIREHMTTVIGRNLKYWRGTEDRELKDALLRRLQHLHQVSFKLGLIHITDLSSNSGKQSSLINSIIALSKHWHIDVSILRRNNTATRDNS
ncbi:thioredoxin domain-containing protein 11 isoform X2 [Manduca sexta]|uniref:thioredoxin domain-containing protein 11 isoform X2 n=1 Tax=Manduca sexta TaxID=7130 RepID=UPI00188FDEFA|nr:thioredoxin domain-containing protein 11 isoform X2 [Manduca sexta]